MANRTNWSNKIKLTVHDLKGGTHPSQVSGPQAGGRRYFLSVVATPNLTGHAQKGGTHPSHLLSPPLYKEIAPSVPCKPNEEQITGHAQKEGTHPSH